ncbi:MAG: hypothetical protein ACJ8GW_12550 [Massilia sp.]
MVDHENLDGKSAAQDTAPALPALTPRGASRRRIAGLGVSGVVMTVASTNAMASLVCKSPSGALSGNLASQRPTTVCNGVSPGYWKTHQGSWPSEVKTSDLFSKFFNCTSALGSMNCKTIITPQKLDKDKVAMHILATYLNVCSGRINFLTRQQVINMWGQYNATGYYKPAEGATPWNGAQLVAYLQSTQS